MSGRPPSRPWWRSWRGGLLATGAAISLAVIAYVAFGTGGLGGAIAWARLGTADVHSLAFDPRDAQHVYFGHHNGLLESVDGGRTWQATGLGGADAMNVRIGDVGVLQIAGHNVYMESTDSGSSWQSVPNDLPGLDLHAFVTDPSDSAHSWAYAVGFGLFETADRGRHWEFRQPGDWPVLTAYRSANSTVLVGVSASGLTSSADGGRTWQSLSSPGHQVASLAAASDGSVLLAGTASGLFRSIDGGTTWLPTTFGGTALTVAVAPNDPQILAVVDDRTRYFRSDDGGASWPGPT